MAFVFQKTTILGPGKSLGTNNYDQIWFAFKEFMRTQAGWTVPQSGDGLSVFKQDGTQAITQAGSGANGMANAKSWFVLKEPNAWQGQQRQFLFDHIWNSYTTLADAAYMNIVYSVQGFQTTGSTSGFNNAACSATNPAQAFDGVPINYALASGNSPAYTISPVTLWTNAPTKIPANQYFQGSPYDAMTVIFCASTTAPYFWYIMGVSQAYGIETSSAPVFFICYDPLSGFDTGDQDPVVNTSITSQTFQIGSNMVSNGNIASTIRNTWYKWNLAGLNQTGVTNAIAAQTTLFSNGGYGSRIQLYSTTNVNATNIFISQSPYNPTNKLASPLLYSYRAGSTYYFKGMSSNILQPLTAMAPWQTFSISGTGNYISIPDGSQTDLSGKSATILLPWDGSNPTF